MARGTDWSQLGRDKLYSSGLTPSGATELGMYEVASAAQLHSVFAARPALVIPYFDLSRKPMASRAGWPQYYRVRYLGKAPLGFKEAAGKDAPKYMQEPDSPVHAYFPKSIDWHSIAKASKVDLVITEGELKAAAGCQAGIATIGLGGVWSFKSMKEGILFLPELESFDFAKRKVFICFDSDYADKPQICGAINGLAEELQHRGALIKYVSLPAAGEKKVGLDDYLLEHSADDFKELMRSGETLAMTEALWALNKDVTYVENPGLVVAGKDMTKLAVEAFKAHSRWATDNTVEATMSVKGIVAYEKVPVAQAWIRWPLRATAKKMTYAPGEERMTEDGELNLWPGWGCQPKKGDVMPWLKLTRFIFADAEPEVLEHFYDWCAYPIQNPGAKMFTGVVIYGVAQGTGKTLIGYTLGKIYGPNFQEITDADLQKTFWAENKQFILGDEVSGKDNREYANTLKRLITKDTVGIDIKYVAQYELPNRMNFMFTSQHGDSFFLEDKDRRFLVVEVMGDPLPQAFYDEYDKWYKVLDGPSRLMQWLLDRKISKDFNPSGHAPKTAAKERMISATKGDLGTWVQELRMFPEQVLTLGQMMHARDLFTSKELLTLYEAVNPLGKVTANGLSRALMAAGFVQVSGGQVLKSPNGKMERYFAVRNMHIWNKLKDRKKMEANVKLQPIKRGS